MLNFFYFSKNGLEYEVELNSGVPAIESATNPVPFISDNKDRIPIVLFGTDSLVRYVNQNEGKKEVQLISDYIELSVTDRGSAKNLEGKTGKTYTMKIARCDEGSAIFSLYNGDTLVASQEAKPGDMLFTSELKKAVMLTYLNRDYSHGRCEFRYAIGAYLEKIYDGKEFPVGSGSGWTSYLEFGNNKLKRIVFKREGLSEEGPIEAGQSIGILPAGETEGNGFCSLKFFGVVR